jgi:hypothetical protein
LSPKTKYIHGFNYNYNKSDALPRLDEVARQAFKSVGSNLLYAELGNEADLAPGRTPRSTLPLTNLWKIGQQKHRSFHEHMTRYIGGPENFGSSVLASLGMIGFLVQLGQRKS